MKIIGNRRKLLVVGVAIVTTLAAHLDSFAWLPLSVQHGIELVSFVVSIAAAVLVDPTKAPTGVSAEALTIIAKRRAR
jgi:hypothetical protein